MRTTGILSYLLADELNSTTIALDSTGATQAVQLFSPYGSVRYSQGSMPTTYNFTGQRLDSQTGLLYYNSRYYDPLSGRFIRTDTVQNNANGLDPYAYVIGNPETKNDPTGSKACDMSGDCAPLTSIVTPSSPPPTPPKQLKGDLCIFGCGNIRDMGLFIKGTLEIAGGIVFITGLLAALSSTDGATVWLARAGISQAARYILDGIKNILNSRDKVNPWTNVLLDSAKVFADILTDVFLSAAGWKILTKPSIGATLWKNLGYLAQSWKNLVTGGEALVQTHVERIAQLTITIGGSIYPAGFSTWDDVHELLNDFAIARNS